MSANQTTYQGTILDNLNPSTTVANVDSLLNLYRGYDKQDKAQWKRWQEEIAFKKSQVDRRVMNGYITTIVR